MTAGAECVSENESLADAARTIRDLDAGALPMRRGQPAANPFPTQGLGSPPLQQ